jgi:ABC-type antimicrobial peptide transport system permease subunit
MTSLRSSIASVNPNLPVDIETMDFFVDSAMAQPRVRTVLLASFALLAVLLTAVGIYGVMSGFVNERTREIGIRMAPGARKEQVLRLIVAKGLVLTLTGLTIGVAVAIAFTRMLSTLLFGVTPTDLFTYCTVSVALTVFSLGAIYIPARRATRVDPILALRHE